jgi:serine/threonine-protein kinase PknG
MKCTQPGCTGTIVDGYCDVCGSPGPAEGSAVPSTVASGNAATATAGVAMAHLAPSPAAPARSSTATATSAAARQRLGHHRRTMIKRRSRQALRLGDHRGSSRLQSTALGSQRAPATVPRSPTSALRFPTAPVGPARRRAHPVPPAPVIDAARRS